MKKILTLLALITAVTVNAADAVATLTANTAFNLLSTGKIIDAITVTATTANTTTVNFYDSSNTTTTYVQTAYGNIISYSTNFSQIFTNENGIVITNTFVGQWSGAQSVSASTNSRPAVQIIIVPGNTSRAKVVNAQTVLGLTAQANQGCIVEVSYRNQ